MDYSYNVGMFTKGQVDRMYNHIKKYRNNFLNLYFCVETSSIITPKNPKPTINKTKLGDICIINPNVYSRKVILKHKSTGAIIELLIGKSKSHSITTTQKSCKLDIPIGTYSCKSYTTFGNHLEETTDIRVLQGKQTDLLLVRTNHN